MTLTAVGLPALLGLALLSEPPPPPADEAIPGLRTWVDVCTVTDRDLLRLTRSEAAMIAPGFLVPNLDRTYHLDRQRFQYIPSSGPGAPLCTDSRFYGQPRPDGFPAGRSAFLVGPDLVLTANHFIDPHVVPLHDFVFGLQYHRDLSGACVLPDLDRIPASDVYHAVEILAHGGDALDFVLLRLDRPVPGRPFVRVRRSGKGDVGDRATVIGHPEMLPTKVDLAASYEGATSTGMPLINGAHTLVGSSGSMIYNRNKQLLESVVRTFACAYYAADPTGCYRLASSCAGGPFPLGHGVRAFSENIPAFELVVDSLDDVVYVAPVGGPLPEPKTDYKLSAPATATAPISYHVEPPAPAGLGEPTLELKVDGPLDGELPVGKTLAAETKASIDGVPCGRYLRSFQVRDVTHAYLDTLRHVFEIGLSEFQVSPPTGLTVIDLAPPYEGVAVYEVVNPRPDAVTLVVAAERDWVTLNGTSAPAPGVPPSIRLSLAPAGRPGDSTSVVVGIGGYVEALPLGTWHYSDVTFTNVTGTCEALGNTVRKVSLLPGQAQLWSTDTPKPVPDGQPWGITSKIAVPEAFCVADVDLVVHTTGAHANHLAVELVSPAGQVVHLWDHHGLDRTDIRRRFDDDSEPAPTGERLSAFNGREGGGAWVLRLVDDVAGGENALDSWWLSLRSSGTPPCQGEAVSARRTSTPPAS